MAIRVRAATWSGPVAIAIGAAFAVAAAADPAEPKPTEPTGPTTPAADVTCAAPRPGTLTLNTVPWTVVSVDGVVVGTTPLYRVELPAGPHELHLDNPSRDVAVDEDIVIDAGRAHRIKLVLQTSDGEAVLNDRNNAAEVDCIADGEAASLTVDTKPWTKVFVDGRLAGVTPVFRHKIAAGAHALRVVAADGSVRAVRIQATAGEVVKVLLSLDAEDPVDAAAADTLDVR